MAIKKRHEDMLAMVFNVQKASNGVGSLNPQTSCNFVNMFRGKHLIRMRTDFIGIFGEITDPPSNQVKTWYPKTRVTVFRWNCYD